MAETQLPEPWLRGTLTDTPSVQRAVLHALELAKEDLAKWCGRLSDAELNARPANLAPVAFHIRHISRSIDRLLTYAEGNELGEAQMDALRGELDPGAGRDELFAELESALAQGASRVRAFRPKQLEDSRAAGKKRLPTTAGGLLIHIAEHTQRHVGQAITTAKIIAASRK
ncbi:MAG: DinB family protein [Candidatus Acidiferrales bacterium]